jgi:hypothetical protein
VAESGLEGYEGLVAEGSFGIAGNSASRSIGIKAAIRNTYTFAHQSMVTVTWGASRKQTRFRCAQEDLAKRMVRKSFPHGRGAREGEDDIPDNGPEGAQPL